nr:reverse transcriptase domain-containing protein [Tanacetum cinerariifolium]
MRIDELHKFNDTTLNDVRTALDDHLKRIRMQYLPQSIWRQSDKDKAAAMIQAIDKQLKTRRIMQSLEKFVGTDKLPVIISKELKDKEKVSLLTVLKSHKRAIAWKISDIKGIDPRFCTHKILMEDDFKPAVQHQRRVNPKIHKVIKKEVIKLLDAGLIYPISDIPWVSLVHYVPKKGGMTVVENEDNELIPTRLVTGWRVFIDYRKLNDATHKDHFSLPFMDQMLERLAGNEYYCFLDVTMADNHTMEEMLQAPTKGYGDAIVSTHLKNEITRFNQKFEETFGEAWERFKEMLRQCPDHGFLELHQINTFYNGLNEHEQDSLHAAAGGNLLSRTPRDVLTIIENKSKVGYSRNKLVASKVSTTSSGSSSSTDAKIHKLTDTISNLVETFNKKMTTPATVKAVEETCVTCGGAHLYYDCIATDSNTSSACAATVQNRFLNEFVHYMKMNDDNMKTKFQSTLRSQNNMIDQNQNEIKNMLACLMNNPSGLGSLPSNTIVNSRGDLKEITTRSGVSYDRPPIPLPFSSLPEVVEQPVVAQKPKPTIPYPSRVTKQKLREKYDNLALKFVEIFRKLHFDLSFTHALLYMPKFSIMLKSLLNNKEKLFDIATTPVNENCSAVILKKLPEKLGDPSKFLIPCDFPELVECLALGDLGTSIILMPLSIWKKLSLPELTPTRMILELANRLMTRPVGIAEDIFVKVGKFHFSTDFVVVYYVVDPRVPLILRRPFLRTEQALIDVYGEELTLRVDDEAITIKVGQTSKYSYNNVESINQIDVIDVACEEYVQEVLGFSNTFKSGNSTLILDPTIALSSPSLTPFERGDFILEEIDACLTSKSIPLGINDTNFDLEGDIHLLEKLLNDDPSSSPLPLKELNVEETKTVKSSIDEPLELELKELPSHLEYAFLEGTDKLPVIISKELKDEEKYALLKVLKSHKRAITWKISNIKVLSKTIVYTDHSALKYLLPKQDAKPRLLWWILLLQEFDIIIRDKKGEENLAADHLSRLENPHHDELKKKEITKTFPLETLGENRASWSDKLDDALKAFRTTFKTPIGCTPYKLVYGKACHLPIELEYKAYWALNHCNFDLKTAGDHRKVQLN